MTSPNSTGLWLNWLRLGLASRMLTQVINHIIFSELLLLSFFEIFEISIQIDRLSRTLVFYFFACLNTNDVCSKYFNSFQKCFERSRLAGLLAIDSIIAIREKRRCWLTGYSRRGYLVDDN